MLIVGRAIAGGGAAALFSGGMTIIGYAVALRKRAIYIALLSSMFGISSVVGPILGGVLTDKASWRWCFVSLLHLVNRKICTNFVVDQSTIWRSCIAHCLDIFQGSRKEACRHDIQAEDRRDGPAGRFFPHVWYCVAFVGVTMGRQHLPMERLKGMGMYPRVWIDHQLFRSPSVQTWG